jgi:hypothetical protein
MKKILLVAGIFIFVSVFLSCKKEPQTVVIENTRGYNCENYTCKLVESGAQYVTLLDCKSECADKRPGAVSLSYSWINYSYYSGSATLSLYYNSSDVNIDAYFARSSSNSSPVILFKDNLPPANYYYKLVFKDGQTYSAPYIKTGLVEVQPGVTTELTITL